jgi:hypothetical protein
LKLGKSVLFPKANSTWIGLRELSKSLSTFWLTGSLGAGEARDVICALSHQRGEHGLKDLQMQPKKLTRQLIDTLYLHLPHLHTLTLRGIDAVVDEHSVSVRFLPAQFPFITVRDHASARSL